jgi:hypothetical protein
MSAAAPFASYWYAALAARHGIVIETDNVQLLVGRLYTARREAADPDLDRVSILNSPTTPGQVWLVKKGTANGST